MILYFLSGLGADRRAFKHLRLPAGTNAIFLDWLTPAKNETLSDYAKSMSQLIDDSKPFVLIGMSFGGILASEMLAFVKPQKTILISSVTRRQELPFLYQLAGLLKLNKLLPVSASNRSNVFTYWMFGITSQQDKLLLDEILKSTDTKFSKWAINEIINWKRNQSPGIVVRIHGDKDRILPVTNFKPAYLLKGAGHFMIVNRASEISAILQKEIALLTH